MWRKQSFEQTVPIYRTVRTPYYNGQWLMGINDNVYENLIFVLFLKRCNSSVQVYMVYRYTVIHILNVNKLQTAAAASINN